MSNDEKVLKMLEAMQAQLGSMQNQLNEHDHKFDAIQTQLKEHGVILGALQHDSEVRKADMDYLTHQIAGLSGDLTELRKETAEKLDTLDSSVIYLANKLTQHDMQLFDLKQRAKKKC